MSETKSKEEAAEESMAALNRLEAVFSLFNHFGFNCIEGDVVPMAIHMLQAAHIAKINDASKEMIIASLMHNIGQVVANAHNWDCDE